MTAYFVAISIAILIYMLMAFGLSLHYGFAGLMNFGHVGFFAIGAYTSALLAMHGVPVPLAMLAAVLLAALSAWPMGVIALRLNSDYLAIVTLGFSETVRYMLQTEEWLTRGVHGLPGIPRMYQGLLPSGEIDIAIMATLAVVCVVVFFGMRIVVRSAFGLVIQAVRDNEPAVQALGKNTAGFKTRVLVLGAALAGLAGSFEAHYFTFLSPDQFVPLITFYIWIAIFIGGAKHLGGVALGTIILIGFLEGSRFVPDWVGWITDVQMASVRIWVIGMALILIVLYRPQGFIGKKAGHGRTL